MSNVSPALEFMRRHRWHLLLLIPGAISITALHESAHAISVLLQGGTITEFAILPTQGNWGHVSFNFASGAPKSKLLLATAPYIFWLCCAIIVWLISRRDSKLDFWLSSILYVWGFAIPLGDIANAYIPWLLHNSKNDFHSAFGQPSLQAAVIFPIALIFVYLWGFRVQKNLYARDCLAVIPYSMLFGGAIAGVMLLNI